MISETSQACYLDWVNPEYFKYQNTSGKEIYYEYIGDFDNGNLLINFKLKDKYNNSIEKEDYFINRSKCTCYVTTDRLWCWCRGSNY